MILVMFDIDGTLTTQFADEYKHFTRALCRVFDARASDLKWGEPTHITDVGIASEVVRQTFGREVTQAELDRLREIYMELMWPSIEKDCKPIAGGIRFLEILTSRSDLLVGFATGNWREVGKKKLESAGYSFQGMPFATSTDALARHEIMRHGYQQALSQGQVEAFGQVVYLGDGAWDAEASLKLGWKFIGISSKLSRNDLLKLGAAAVFENYCSPDDVIQAILG